jgi:hypothetical protein
LLCFQIQLVPLRIGTTSLPFVFEDMGLTATFNVSLHCPLLGGEDARAVLAQLAVFEVGLVQVDSRLESAWFQPSNLKCMPDLSGLYLG